MTRKLVSLKEFWLLLAAAVLAFLYTFYSSFRTPIVGDIGVFVDRSWKIFNGEVPARDFFCPTTPATYFIQALVYKIFSPSVFWMKIYLASQMTLAVLLIGWVAVRALKIRLLWLSLLVLPMTIVWNPGIHLKMPWYDIDAIFFSVAALFFLCRAFEEGSAGRGFPLFVAGAASALSFLSKQNVGGGAVMASWLFIALQPGNVRNKTRGLMMFSLGAVLPLALLYLYFLHHGALRDAWVWMFARASQRFDEHHFMLYTLLRESCIAVFGSQNNFVKFVLPLYLVPLGLSFFRRNEPEGGGPLRLGVALYCFVVMWIGVVQFHGMRYPAHQIYLGLSCGILAMSSGVFTGLKPFSPLKLMGAALCVLWFGVSMAWALSIRFRQSYNVSEIRWTVDSPSLKGMYFRQGDAEIMDSLLQFEKTIPKSETIFLMPDPLFFFMGTGRVSPVPITNFLISGWELNQEEADKIPEWLEQKDVRWVFIGKEEYFDSAFLRFGLTETWQEAVKSGKAMMSRGNYQKALDYILANFEEVPGPKGYWALKRKQH